MAYTLVKTYLEVFEGFNLLGRFVEVKLTKILGGSKHSWKILRAYNFISKTLRKKFFLEDS